MTTDSVARVRTLALTTRGRKSGRPRTVKIWFVVAGPNRLYVQHTNPKPAEWYRNLVAEPAVTIDFGSGPLPGRAVAITEPEKVQQVLALVRRKYVAAWLFRLLGWGQSAVAAEISLVE